MNNSDSTPRVVVTRHKALVDYLREIGICDGSETVIVHATPTDIAGKHVIGVLPLHLAACAAMVTEIPMTIPAELRGVELNLEQMRAAAGEPATYRVERINTKPRFANDLIGGPLGFGGRRSE